MTAPRFERRCARLAEVLDVWLVATDVFIEEASAFVLKDAKRVLLSQVLGSAAGAAPVQATHLGKATDSVSSGHPDCGSYQFRRHAKRFRRFRAHIL